MDIIKQNFRLVKLTPDVEPCETLYTLILIRSIYLVSVGKIQLKVGSYEE